jgi:hypothetical protein
LGVQVIEQIFQSHAFFPHDRLKLGGDLRQLQSLAGHDDAITHAQHCEGVASPDRHLAANIGRNGHGPTFLHLHLGRR